MYNIHDIREKLVDYLHYYLRISYCFKIYQINTKRIHLISQEEFNQRPPMSATSSRLPQHRQDYYCALALVSRLSVLR